MLALTLGLLDIAAGKRTEVVTGFQLGTCDGACDLFGRRAGCGCINAKKGVARDQPAVELVTHRRARRTSMEYKDSFQTILGSFLCLSKIWLAQGDTRIPKGGGLGEIHFKSITIKAQPPIPGVPCEYRAGHDCSGVTFIHIHTSTESLIHTVGSSTSI